MVSSGVSGCKILQLLQYFWELHALPSNMLQRTVEPPAASEEDRNGRLAGGNGSCTKYGHCTEARAQGSIQPEPGAWGSFGQRKLQRTVEPPAATCSNSSDNTETCAPQLCVPSPKIRRRAACPAALYIRLPRGGRGPDTTLHVKCSCFLFAFI